MIEVKVPNVVNNLESLLSNKPDLLKTHANGLINPEGTIQFIGIPKNASTYFQMEAERQGWSNQILPLHHHIKRFAILRDPYERYISGIAEDLDRYITLENDSRVFIQHLFTSNLVFDFFNFLFDLNIFELGGHSTLQNTHLQYIINTIGKNDITFIKLSNTLGEDINQFLQSQNCKGNFSNEKFHEKKTSNQSFLPLVQYYFAHVKNKKRKDQLITYLQPDYGLLNSINFFNRFQDGQTRTQ